MIKTVNPDLPEIGVENIGIKAGAKLGVGDGEGDGLFEELGEGEGVASTALPEIIEAPAVSLSIEANTVT